MFCTNCGEKLEEGARFCPNCGARLEDQAAEATQDVTSGPALDETRVAPVPPTTVIPKPEPDAAPDTAFAYQPDSTTVIPPAATVPPAPASVPRKEGQGLTVVAAVMVTLAVVAVLALVVVLVKPFGLGSVAQAPATQQPAEPAEPSEPSEPAPAEKPEEPAAPAEPSKPADEPDDEKEPSTSEDSPEDPLTDPDGYVMADSASRLYTTDDLAGLDNWHLYLARNEIFARHGREFNNSDLKAYFESKSWYTPTCSPSDFDAQSTSLLSETERKNAETMLKVEQDRGSEYL